jgi:hypothetical protein
MDSHVGEEIPREYREWTLTQFLIWPPFGKLTILRAISKNGIGRGTRKCAEFGENGCKFILISSLRGRILRNYVGKPKVRK